MNDPDWPVWNPPQESQNQSAFTHADSSDTSRYQPDGELSVTIQSNGGPPTATLMEWMIDEDGVLLVSKDGDFRNARGYNLIARDRLGFDVRFNGRTIRLDYLQPEDGG